MQLLTKERGELEESLSRYKGKTRSPPPRANVIRVSESADYVECFFGGIKSSSNNSLGALLTKSSLVTKLNNGRTD